MFVVLVEYWVLEDLSHRVFVLLIVESQGIIFFVVLAEYCVLQDLSHRVFVVLIVESQGIIFCCCSSC